MKRVSLPTSRGSSRGCGGPKVGPNGVTASDAVVYLSSNISDAQVYVDGQFVGPISVIGAASPSIPASTASSCATRITSRVTSSST